jgi:hypothetical protein
MVTLCVGGMSLFVLNKKMVERRKALLLVAIRGMFWSMVKLEAENIMEAGF